MHTPLCRFIPSTHSYRACAQALHATTSSCVITPTATATAAWQLCIGHHQTCLEALHPGGRTGHIRNVASYTYNTHTHIHRDCACDCACAFHLLSHLGRNTPPSATRNMRAAQCTIPQCRMRAAAHSDYVRSQFSFLSRSTFDGRS